MPLGRGLESLIPKKRDGESSKPSQPVFLPANDTNDSLPDPLDTPELESESNSPREPKKKSQEAVFQIEVEKIKPNPLQPRKEFDEDSLKELAASIREHGIIQPLIVTKIEKETESGTAVEYQLIAGERRLRAAKLLGWERVPAIVRKIDLDSTRLEMAIIENLQRENLNPVETARAYAKLQDEFNLTQREIAARLGKSRETVANSVRLLNLPTEIQDALSKNQINESQARLLLVIPDLIEQQNLFRELLSKNMSVRELKMRVRKSQPQKEGSGHSNRSNPEIKSMEEELSQALGAKVDIDPPTGTNKTGKIVITFYSPEEIRGIIKKINPNED
ncbi:MAG: ParB/RepB/Spo0J family partition protein [Candidatus Wolfebacteria bacterium]|nr:ParB/RepB/Spo0J family partition protein [Candidatus Wolfebacteria bacterium]